LSWHILLTTKAGLARDLLTQCRILVSILALSCHATSNDRLLAFVANAELVILL
jgi:hypothetical protein